MVRYLMAAFTMAKGDTMRASTGRIPRVFWWPFLPGCLYAGPALAAPPAELAPVIDRLVTVRSAHVPSIRVVFPRGTFRRQWMWGSYGHLRRDYALGHLLLDARDVPTAVFASPEVRISWKYGEYLWAQSISWSEPVALPFLADVDALWDEAVAGFPQTTFTPRPDLGATSWEVELPSMAWAGGKELTIQYLPHKQEVSSISWVTPGEGLDSAFHQVGLPLVPFVGARFDAPVDPADLVALAEPDRGRGVWLSPITRTTRPYVDQFRRSDWQMDAASETHASIRELAGLREVTCEGTTEQTYVNTVHFLAPPDAASAVELAQATCEEPPLFDFYAAVGGEVPKGVRACVGATFTVKDHGSSPPREIGTQIVTSCAEGEAVGLEAHRRRVMKRFSLEQLGLTATEVGDLQVRVDTQISVLCDPEAVGKTFAVDVAFRDPKRRTDGLGHGFSPTFENPPHFRWDCYAGW